MSALAESFPSLRVMAGVRPFMPKLIDQQLSHLTICEPELHAGRLVLSVWSCEHPWKAGRFDLFEALLWWDAEHRASFLRWVQSLR